MTDTIEEIRARHEVAESDGRYDLSWHEDYGLTAHYDRATLLRALDAAQEELSTWQSVFPDIAPDSVLPDRSKLEAELLAMAEENARLREALQAIADSHIPDQPAAYDVSEADFTRKHHMELRMLARAALKETGQ